MPLSFSVQVLQIDLFSFPLSVTNVFISLHGRSRKCQEWELRGGLLVFCNRSSAGLPQSPLQHGCVLRERPRSPQGHRERKNPDGWLCFFFSASSFRLRFPRQKSVFRWFLCVLFKALHHYWQAAIRGHREAQYHYAKLLLTKRGQQSLEELNTAISLLEQSAEAGLAKVRIMTDSSLSQNTLKVNYR